ncbi:MAG: alpha/beta hydrolase [Victivallales bacterium]|nr:alpha/beta hydrolase [Victivallales bacterium]
MMKKYVLLLCVCAMVFGKDWPIYKIGIHENVPYLEKGRNELLDVYYPADAKPDEKFPGIVIIHGGGWTGGQRDAAREINIASNLVRMGYVCISIDYVLSQKGKGTWPRNFMDCKTAVQWMRVNAEKLHVIPDKIGCIGGSAGGHLSTLLAVGGKDMGLEPTSPYGNVDTSIQAGVNLYGIMDLTKWRHVEKDGTPIEGKYKRPAFMGKKYEDDPELWKFASPINQLDKNDPPILQLQGLADPTVDWWQARDMKAALDAVGIENELMLIPGIGHTFALQHPGNKDYPKEIRPAVIRFYDKHLKGLDDATCKERYDALLAWEAAHPDDSLYWMLNINSGKLVKNLGKGRWIIERDGKEIEIQLSEKTTVKSEKEVAVTDMADGQIVNGYGKRNEETDVTLDKLVILDKSYGRMALGNISFLNSTLKKTENGWSVETIRNGQQQKTLWPLKLSDKFNVYRRQFGTVDDMQVGMRIVQMTGKAAGELRLVNTVVLQGK